MRTYLSSVILLLAGIILSFARERTVPPPPFFTDTIIDLNSRPEEYLRYLTEYHSSYGLYTLTVSEECYWVETITGLNVVTDTVECSGVEYGIILCNGHYLFGGLDSVRTGRFEDIIVPDSHILPEGYRFEFGGRQYELLATGEYEVEQFDTARNVKIKFRDLTSGIEQELAYIEQLEYTVPSVLYICDLDGDGRPDFVLQQGYNYELHEIHLYVSSLSGPEKLVGRAGYSAMWRDC